MRHTWLVLKLWRGLGGEREACASSPIFGEKERLDVSGAVIS
jgi:hypothetical protein